jgi:GNAT superfamily N-acetyltransferase
MIKKLKTSHIKRSFEIITSAISSLKSQQIDQWDEKYPAYDDIKQDIEKAQAFGYFMEDHLTGYVALNQETPGEYSDVVFKYDNESALIVHRLTVDPLYQNCGIAGKLMRFSEDFARENGYTSIRLDAFSRNLKAVRFYHTLNYREVGKVLFRKGVFHIFEKGIKKH